MQKCVMRLKDLDEDSGLGSKNLLKRTVINTRISYKTILIYFMKLRKTSCILD